MNKELSVLLHTFRTHSQSEREKGTYFEELVQAYLQNEPKYKELFSDVWLYSEYAQKYNLTKRDTGIDLVAKTFADELYAIQCKFYAEDYRIQKSDIDSFFTASGKKEFSQRIIISTTNLWSDNAEDALLGQNPPVTKISYFDLENSVIQWKKYVSDKKIVLKPKKKLRDHQTVAISRVKSGLATEDRGKLIMACGTGKTFTSLKLTEEIVGKGKTVLFLVPSLALLSQTLTEWTQESEIPLKSFAVCSDSEIGKKRGKDSDKIELFSHELAYPSTTDAKSLGKEFQEKKQKDHINVIFSTYHSIEVIHKAQKNYDLPEFDLIICDEAHRTTGATFDEEDESNFVKIHNNSFIKGKKRIYMTATPRIYGEVAKASADNSNVALCSMDDEKLYGKNLHVLTFSESVQRGLLVDYKVIVLAVDEAHISSKLQNLLSQEDNEIKIDDAGKIIGCWKALSKQGSAENKLDHSESMKRAVAFCQVIEYNKGSKTHKISSKMVADMFQKVVDAYQEMDTEPNPIRCEVKHVDGAMNASIKEEKLSWLKEDAEENICRILSNVRCLSEGVDVPSLDAVLFLTPRNSQVEVVQSVGRVMRLAPNKKMGYVVLPVVIPAGLETKQALDDNKRFKVVWQVLQALRAHDDRFDAMINKLDLVGADPEKMEVVCITDKVAQKRSPKKTPGVGEDNFNKPAKKSKAKEEDDKQQEFHFQPDLIQVAIYAKLVDKCGNRHHWEDWANDIAKIANTHITRIKTIVQSDKNTKAKKAFEDFADELRDDLNDSIKNEEVIEMLAQHLITKPVFEALFGKYQFTKENLVSQAMDKILEILEEHNIDKEADTLEKFYASVKLRAEGIENAQGRQKIILELYDKFFRNAFPKLTERLGIVYTPVEAVDFMIHSVDYLLQKEFKESLGSPNVQILDPFVGTGTFITRLMQSGLLTKEELIHKYKSGLHANEIVLLAYYIAAINIESTYHEITGERYSPFTGILLTDTFQLFEKDDLISRMLVDNSERRIKQKTSQIKVILGNPPYSAGQKDANDNNQNVKYPILDERIMDTYVQYSKSTNKNSLYDSYIRAIRWASDRIESSGIICFITNAGWIESNSTTGLRKCLEEEFSSIYIYHLRGNGRTSGERCRKEGHPFFAAHGGRGGSLTPISINLLVKNKDAKVHGKIYFKDIGDYLSREEKLDKLKTLVSIANISDFAEITPDKHHDWIGQRDDSFEKHISLGDKKDKSSVTIFENYSRGVATSRDTWVYNFSEKQLMKNMKLTLNFYNNEMERYAKVCKGKGEDKFPKIEDFVNNDSTKISWARSTKQQLEKFKPISFDKNKIIPSTYRPFTKQFLYFCKYFNDMQYQLPKIFPTPDSENLMICVSGIGSNKDFSCMITNIIPDLEIVSKSQCFPLYLYESIEEEKGGLFSSNDVGTGRDLSLRDKRNQPDPHGLQKKSAITDEGLQHYAAFYNDPSIQKEDLFYYIYGILHSEEYRNKYKDNLSKELPRIPRVKSVSDFWKISEIGRKLAKIHLNYESAELYPVTINGDGKDRSRPVPTATKPEHYYVRKMKFASKEDKTKVIYNDFITLSDIPLEAYDYIVNGKPALEWVMERYAVTTDKDSGIKNDANDYAIETEDNPKYILELFQRVITVSLETRKLVGEIPGLGITV